MLLASCAHETVQRMTRPALMRVEENGNPYQDFAYTGNKLVREVYYSTFCNQASDEFSYVYRKDKVVKMNMTLRSLQHTLAPCNEKEGLPVQERFRYDRSGHLLKIIRPGSYSILEYDVAGRIIKESLYSTDHVLKSWNSFSYDALGNLVSETSSDGATTRYDYDDKTNPFYVMDQRPHWVSPFNKSPNNVIRATGAINFTRSLTYNSFGLPSEILETNGLVYTYTYRSN
jgi:hypothetical protein